MKETWPSGRFQLVFGMKPERMPQFAWDELCALRITGKLIMAAMILYAVALCAAYGGIFAGTNFELLTERLFSSGVRRAMMCLQIAECYILLAIWSRLREVVRRAQD